MGEVVVEVGAEVAMGLPLPPPTSPAALLLLGGAGGTGTFLDCIHLNSMMESMSLGVWVGMSRAGVAGKEEDIGLVVNGGSGSEAEVDPNEEGYCVRCCSMADDAMPAANGSVDVPINTASASILVLSHGTAVAAAVAVDALPLPPFLSSRTTCTAGNSACSGLCMTAQKAAYVFSTVRSRSPPAHQYANA